MIEGESSDHWKLSHFSGKQVLLSLRVIDLLMMILIKK